MNVVHLNVSYILWFVVVVLYVNYTCLGKSIEFVFSCVYSRYTGSVPTKIKLFSSGTEISLCDPVQPISAPPPSFTTHSFYTGDYFAGSKSDQGVKLFLRDYTAASSYILTVIVINIKDWTL
jgi:hypothetical protein